MRKRGLIQLDYMIAAGIFITVFAYLIFYTTDYYTTIREITETVSMRSEALSLMGIAEHESEQWDTEYPDRIGIKTKAYRFYILVNNTDPINNLTNELVTFNFTEIGFEYADYNSTMIYNQTNFSIPYQLNNSLVTFRTNLLNSESKLFTIYFDEDSNFTSKSTTILGNYTISKTAFAIEEISILQYNQINKLSNSNYTKMRNSTGVKHDFHIKIYDTIINQTDLDYGKEVPKRGDIIALERYIVFQNSTGGIRNGKLIIQVW